LTIASFTAKWTDRSSRPRPPHRSNNMAWCFAGAGWRPRRMWPL
jgi:hypothetical protein